jgi:hypothetical protein
VLAVWPISRILIASAALARAPTENAGCHLWSRVAYAFVSHRCMCWIYSLVLRIGAKVVRRLPCHRGKDDRSLAPLRSSRMLPPG